MNVTTRICYLQACHGAGFRLEMHAIGDRAAAAVLDAVIALHRTNRSTNGDDT